MQSKRFNNEMALQIQAFDRRRSRKIKSGFAAVIFPFVRHKRSQGHFKVKEPLL
jgi:hypothetical protein